MPEQLLIDYQIECTDLKRAVAIAEEIALEQTVETPPSLVKDEFWAGRLHHLEFSYCRREH